MYYDRSGGRSIEENSCSLDEWMNGETDVNFAVTPEGGKVFLPPSELAKSDEHKHGDPYAVKDGLNEESFFEERRFRCTKRLLEREEVGNVERDNIRVLDVGCGEGYITEDVKDIFPKSTIVGVDYSISAIRRAAARENNIEWVVANVFSLPFQPGYFDIIICTNVWEHVHDPMLLLDELREISREGGHLLMSTPSRYRIRNAVRVLMGKNVIFMSDKHVTEYTVGQVKECFESSDMSVIDVDSISPGYPNDRSITSIIGWFLKVVSRGFLGLVGSHHILEPTAFYLTKFD
jgi:2-polyprenyl-3-methyl-5-hydroxy-6-metoxy-1,4-benzoquinol methylase